MSNKNPEQWRNKLSAEQFRVCWEKGTEQPYSGALLHNRKSGDYLCVCCKSVLFTQRPSLTPAAAGLRSIGLSRAQ